MAVWSPHQPFEHTDAKLIVFAAHHFEVQIVFISVCVDLKCCDRCHLHFLPSIPGLKKIMITKFFFFRFKKF